MSEENMDAQNLMELIKKHEGLRLHPYKDTVGKLTIGYGRNLDDVGISLREAEYLLLNDINKVVTALKTKIPWIEGLNAARQAVLYNMAFNLGVAGLLKFETTLKMIEEGKYRQASAAMLNSKWAGQVGRRAWELAKIMDSGKIL